MLSSLDVDKEKLQSNGSGQRRKRETYRNVGGSLSDPLFGSKAGPKNLPATGEGEPRRDGSPLNFDVFAMRNHRRGSHGSQRGRSTHPLPPVPPSAQRRTSIERARNRLTPMHRKESPLRPPELQTSSGLDITNLLRQPAMHSAKGAHDKDEDTEERAVRCSFEQLVLQRRDTVPFTDAKQFEFTLKTARQVQTQVKKDEHGGRRSSMSSIEHVRNQQTTGDK